MEVCTMYNRPPDIEELERMLNDAEHDDALNKKAIEIYARLKTTKTIRRYFGNINTIDVDKTMEDLRRVLEKIRLRRRDGVLDEYEKYIVSG